MLSRHTFTSGPLSVFKTEREYFTCSMFIPVSTVTAVRQRNTYQATKHGSFLTEVPAGSLLLWLKPVL